MKQDTLLLICKDSYDTTYSETLKFEIGLYRLSYTDTSDKNRFTNWGNFIFTGFVSISDTVTREVIIQFRHNFFRFIDIISTYDLYVDEYGWLRRKWLPGRFSFH